MVVGLIILVAGLGSAGVLGLIILAGLIWLQLKLNINILAAAPFIWAAVSGVAMYFLLRKRKDY